MGKNRAGQIRVIGVIGGSKVLWFRPRAGLGNPWTN